MPTDSSGWSDWLVDQLSTDDVTTQILQLAAILVGIWVLRLLLLRVVIRRTQDASTVYWATKISAYVATALSIYFFGQIWFGQFGGLLTFVGLITAGLAIALRDPVTNMFAWGFIIWRRPFELGHRIQIAETIGDVVDIRVFQTSLLEIGNWVAADQPTGRIVHVPNSKVFTELQFNYTLGVPFIWDELPVLVTFESDWERAKEILTTIVHNSIAPGDRPSAADILRISRTFRLGAIHLEPDVFTSVQDSGVLLTLRYPVRPTERRVVSQRIWEAILREFARYPEIDFAYPTTRFYNNRTEGPMAILNKERPHGDAAS